jgi:uncharacterized RDD family membrane protein YckC
MTARRAQADVVTYQGHYAGSVSRFVAYVIDLAVSTAVFTLALAAIDFVVRIVTGNSVSWNRSNVVVAIVFVAWQFFYFGYSWAMSGRTLGMATLGIRVVRADGAEAEPRRGVLRALVFPLSFLLCGLGFLGILVQREHRALHDMIAGTAVIYAWDARAARLRFLARQAELGAADSQGAGRSRLARCPAAGGTGGTGSSLPFARHAVPGSITAHTMWMSQPRSQVCMSESSTPYARRRRESKYP